MKTLIILAHPDIKNSRINKALKTAALESGASISELYEKYPNFNFDIEKEQELLVAHDRIILQFPCFWYSSPPLLKKYFDDIFTYGFAYGSSGKALEGKEFGLSVSFGAKEHEFCEDSVGCKYVDDIFTPFKCSIGFVGAKPLKSFFVFDAQNISDEELKQKTESYKDYIKA